jgi:hypothetical protein
MRHKTGRVASSVAAVLPWALALVVAVPAVAQDVKVKYDEEYNFGEVRTYAWDELEERATNTLIHEARAPNGRSRSTSAG